MTGSLPLGHGLQPPGSLRLERPVWGIDPSTQRISVACVRHGFEWVYTLSLPQPGQKHRRWAAAYEPLADWLSDLAVDRAVPLRDRWASPWPSHVFVEEPFMPTDRRQKPTSYYVLGVLWAALGAALPGHVRFEEINAPAWKKHAMGRGMGGANRDAYFDWARDVAGYEGTIEDEAAAIGIATGGAVLLGG